MVDIDADTKKISMKSLETHGSKDIRSRVGILCIDLRISYKIRVILRVLFYFILFAFAFALPCLARHRIVRSLLLLLHLLEWMGILGLPAGYQAQLKFDPELESSDL